MQPSQGSVQDLEAFGDPPHHAGVVRQLMVWSGCCGYRLLLWTPTIWLGQNHTRLSPAASAELHGGGRLEWGCLRRPLCTESEPS